MRGIAASPLVVLILLGACDQSSTGEHVRTVRDSADVTIVEYAALAHPLAEWTIVEPPDLTLGVYSGPAEEVFEAVTAAIATPDGGLYIADDGASEVRSFDPRGVHRWTVGRRGDGPGEFQSLNGLAMIEPESVAVLDVVMSRVSIYSADGEFVTVRRLDGAISGNGAVILRSGAVAGLRWVDNDAPMRPGTYQTQVAPVFFGPDGNTVAVGPTMVGGDFIRIAAENNGYASFAEPGGYVTQLTGAGTTVAAKASEPFEVIRFDERGVTMSILRVGEGEAERTRFEQPRIDEIRIDDEGRLWVELLNDDEESSSEWIVFSSDNEVVARVLIPEDIRPLYIGSGGLIGVRFDSLGVQRVGRWMIDGAR